MNYMTIEEKFKRFLNKAKLAHPNENLDYSKSLYVNSKTPIEIIDHDLRPNGYEYGIYWQSPENHVRGQGHPDKRGAKISRSKSESQNEIIKRFKEVHIGEKLDYSQVNYVNMHTKVKIISHDLRPDGTEYGEFWQEPISHLRGCTHPDIKKRGRNKKFVNTCINKSSAKTFFGYFKDYKPDENNILVIDGYGLNYIPIKKNNQFDLLNKQEEYYKSGVVLLNIFEDEFSEHENIVLEKINHILKRENQNIPVIGARKCLIKEIDKVEAKNFLDMYHIQGFAAASKYYGAFYGDKILGVMSFIDEGDGSWNLNRFSTNTNYSLPGLGGKMFKHFINEESPDRVKSFLDRRWCFNEKNNLYTNIGFEFDGYVRPDYRYSNGDGHRYHKFGFRKHILNRKYGLPLSMTEREMTEKLGYYKIWDCGLIRYVWKNI